MFKQTYRIEFLANGEINTELFTGNYFQMTSRVTSIRKQGNPIQSVSKI